jgi:DNA modification methylase
MKPIALVERAIRNSSKTQDTVLDPFAGSGTTLMAAEATGRRAALLELDPRYCDVIVRRWQDATGGVALLDSDDRCFAEIGVERLGTDAAAGDTPLRSQNSKPREKRHAAAA